MGVDDGVAFRVEGDGVERRPVARVARPSCRVRLPCSAVQRMTGIEDVLVLADVALRRADVTDAAVTMLDVVPMHEAGRPGACGVEIGEAPGRELRPVLGRSEQRLGIGVVVAHPGPRVRRLHAEPVEHRQHRRGLQRGAVVAVQHGLARQHRDASASAVRRTRCAAWFLKLAQSSKLRRADAAVLLLPDVERRLADAHLAAHLVDAGAQFVVLQRKGDLILGEFALPHDMLLALSGLQSCRSSLLPNGSGYGGYGDRVNNRAVLQE